MTLDVSLFFALNNLAGRSDAFDLLIVFCAKYLAYAVIAVFLTAAYRERDRACALWIPLIATVIARFGITELIRLSYHRPRPFMAHPINPLLLDTAWSFPSGHAAFFFAIATGVYFHSKKWGTALFFIASIITISRVIAGIHYPSDILAGALIGVVCAYAVNYMIGGPRENRTPISRVQGGRSATKL